jgi:hypothetical protein
MTTEQAKLIRDLRSQGWAIICWTPAELGDVDPSHVEDMSIQFVSDYLLTDAFEDETGEDLAQFYGPSARI